jgi:hypothetical protein
MECGVSECDSEGSIRRRPWPIRGCRAMGGKITSNASLVLHPFVLRLRASTPVANLHYFLTRSLQFSL